MGRELEWDFKTYYRVPLAPTVAVTDGSDGRACEHYTYVLATLCQSLMRLF